MGIAFSKAFLVAAIILATGCAPDGSGVEERPMPAAAEAAQETGGSVVAVAGKETVAGRQVALWGTVIDIPFEHKQLYDRMRQGPKDVSERQVGLLAPASDHKALAAELENSLKLAGFETRARENRDDWVWITFSGEGGKAKVAVRPDGKTPGTLVVFKIPQS